MSDILISIPCLGSNLLVLKKIPLGSSFYLAVISLIGVSSISLEEVRDVLMLTSCARVATGYQGKVSRGG